MNNKLYKLMNWPEIEEIIYSDGDDPHRILGAHKAGTSQLVQMFYPGAQKVSVVTEGTSAKTVAMEEADEQGFFAALVPGKTGMRYHYLVTEEDGTERTLEDAYRFESLLTREDCVKFSTGVHYHVYEKMGAHLMQRDGVDGVNFVTWAPDAARVSVIGSFNHWDGRIHQMRRVDEESGLFEIFIPGIQAGDEYQFEMKSHSGMIFKRPDPYALACRDAEGSVSVVTAFKMHRFQDEAWIRQRKDFKPDRDPLSICELSLDTFAQEHKGSKQTTNARELAEDVLEYVRASGYNAIELQPVMEHFEGHYYDLSGYFALKKEYGTMEDLCSFVEVMHAAGIRVILDIVPTFFPRSDSGLSWYDGRALYEYEDLRKGVQPGTGRLIFDYGRKQVTNFLISYALFWTENLHADGLRLTDISKMLYLDYDRRPGEWVPNIFGSNENLEAEEFLKHLVDVVKKTDPGILMITKETACWPQVTESIRQGGLGFDYKWNNGWAHDYLTYVQNDPLFRKGHHNELTFSLIYRLTERFIVAFSHEDVGGYNSLLSMMPGNEAQKEANARMSFAYLFTHPGCKMIYHGQQFKTADKKLEVARFLHDLNDLYFHQPALYELDNNEAGFEWINCMDAETCMISFLRKGKKAEDTLVVVMNMAGVERDFKIGVPFDGKYTELLNTDATNYGGSGEVNRGKVEALFESMDSRPYSIPVHLAPLSLAIFSYTPYTEQEKKIRRIKEEEAARKQKEQDLKRAELEARKAREEEKLLKELRSRYEKELAQQQKAIEEKYQKIEEEKIFSVVSENALKKVCAPKKGKGKNT